MLKGYLNLVILICAMSGPGKQGYKQRLCRYLISARVLGIDWMLLYLYFHATNLQISNSQAWYRDWSPTSPPIWLRLLHQTARWRSLDTERKPRNPWFPLQSQLFTSIPIYLPTYIIVSPKKQNLLEPLMQPPWLYCCRRQKLPMAC